MIIGSIFIYIIIFISPAIIGLIFSIVGMIKQKSPFNIAGLVLNIIAICLYLLRFFIFTFISM